MPKALCMMGTRPFDATRAKSVTLTVWTSQIAAGAAPGWGCLHTSLTRRAACDHVYYRKKSEEH
eukprot:2570086-Pyramimonas_sp.AAC.3